MNWNNVRNNYHGEKRKSRKSRTSMGIASESWMLPSHFNIEVPVPHRQLTPGLMQRILSRARLSNVKMYFTNRGITTDTLSPYVFTCYETHLILLGLQYDESLFVSIKWHVVTLIWDSRETMQFCCQDQKKRLCFATLPLTSGECRSRVAISLCPDTTHK